MGLKLGSLFYDIGANTSGLKKAEKEVATANENMGRSFGKLGSAIAAAFSFEAARRVLLTADNITLLRARVDNLTKTQKESNKVFDEAVAISNRVGQSIDDTVESFQRFTLSRDVVKATNSELLTFTETIQKLGVLSGATSAGIASVSIQIGQALSSNMEAVAQEINSINDQMPKLAKVVEQNMGFAAGSFKKMVTAGKVSARDLFNAVLQSSEKTNKEFEKLPKTMSFAWTELLNNVSLVTDELNEQAGITATISGLFQRMSKFIKEGADARKGAKNREEEISKILKARDVLDYFSKDLTSAKKVYEALLQKEVLLKKIAKAEKSDSIFASDRIANAKRQLEFTDKIIAKLVPVQGRTRDVIKLWVKLTAEMKKAKEAVDSPAKAELMGPPEPSASQRKAGKKGKTFDQFLSALGDERAAIRDESAKLNEEIIASDKLLDSERKHLLTTANEERIIALEDVARREEEILLNKQLAAKNLADKEVADAKHSDKERLANRRSADAAMLGSMSTFGSSVIELTASLGREDSAAAKVAFLGMQAIRVATIIANTEVAASAKLLSPFEAGLIRAAGYTSAGIVAGLAVGKIVTETDPGSKTVAARKEADNNNRSRVGGGRQSGGVVSPFLAHPINENGDPEILQQGAKQYLLPGKKGGNVISGSDMRMSGGGAPSISIINNGAPLEVTGTQISRSEIMVMVKNSENAAVSRVNSSLSSGRGSTSRALKSGFETQRNLG